MLFKEVFSFFYTILSRIRSKLKSIYQNPTSKFYSGSILSNSKLEGYNVLFKNVHVIDSSIGKHSYIQKNSTIVNVEMGRFCSIASNVNIGLGIHKIDSVSTHPSFFLKSTPLIKTFVNKDQFVSSRKITIGHDVWVGEGAIILDGLNIGIGSVIGAGSVVTKDVEPYSIIGGVPARHIKFRFDDNTILLLIKSEWWNNSDKWFEENAELMYNLNLFKSYMRNDQ